MSPMLFVLTCALVVALIEFAKWYAPYHDLTEEGCRLGRVYDGDTVALVCSDETRTARLRGFDTPETRDPGCAAEAALGKAATERLRALVGGGPITLESHGRDKYGRVLTTLRIAGRDVGDTLVTEGLAVAYRGGKRINWCARLGAGE
ncbi:MAG: thermonuclease family protein [Brevirhabdus sp.]